MIIDSSSRRNLELVETLQEAKRGSLLWYSTRHARLWEQDCFAPMSSSLSIEKAEIIKRQKLIEALNANEITRDEIREYLNNPIYLP